MAQHDYSIANASGAAVRSDLNNALSAIVSLNSGATEPTTMFAYMMWADTTAGLIKQRNAANSAWVTVGTLGSANLGLVPAPTVAGTADQVLGTNGSGVQSWVDRARLVRGTAAASTSGVNVDFTGLPSWVRKITVMLRGASTNGASPVQVQLGTASSFETSGYASSAFYYNTGTVSSSTTGLVIDQGGATAARDGSVTILNITGNEWVHSGAILSIGPALSAGSKTLAGALTRIRITTVNGTDTFDAGSINIIYEG